MVLPSKDSTISLPSVRSILDETRPPRSVPTFDRASDGRDTSGPPSQISDEQFREVNGRASTPSLMSLGARHMYPSPSHSSDDLHDDSEMVDGDGSGWWGTTQKPLFQISQPVPDVSKQIDLPDVNMAKPDDGVTPTIVHYRPNGIPSVRSGRKQSAGDVPKVRKSSRQENEEFKVRLVKWDRTTDKGTAPLLNVERRSTGPRTCTLCYISKRKVDTPRRNMCPNRSARDSMANVPIQPTPAQLVKRITLFASLFHHLSFAMGLLNRLPWRV